MPKETSIMKGKYDDLLLNISYKIIMIEIRPVTEEDEKFWFSLDEHMSREEFLLKVRDERGYVLSIDGEPVGVMRYNLFWDNIPFLTMINIDESFQGKGIGKQAMLYWEDRMKKAGYNLVMTSTQIDEQAQHFYRKLEYVDKGALFFDGTGLEQPQEVVMMKVL